MPDLSSYTENILVEEDMPLFKEAVVSANGGALRGAYILIWLSCAESIKRKFREAATRDNAAVQIVAEVEALEARKQSADLTILKRANEYELIDGVVLQKLTHVYDMRCVYGHPYESMPSDEELISAASTVVTEVLSRPTLYKKKYIDTLIERLTGNIDFLESSQESVREYAREISVRIDPTGYKHLANKYSSKLEQMYSDPSLAPLIRRGNWFLSEFLKSVGTDFSTKAQWHEFVLGCPRLSQLIFLLNIELYDAIGRRANDSLISFALRYASARPSGIKRLEPLWETDRLNITQKQAYEALDFSIVQAADLKITTAYNVIIEELKSYTWPRQNPAIKLLTSHDRVQLSELDAVKQENLGRNILQAADGSSGSAISYLTKLSTDHSNYPRPFIKGVLFEGFANESNEFRLKNEGIKAILPLFVDYADLLTELIEDLNGALPKSHTDPPTYDALLEMVNSIDGLSQLYEYFVSNRVRLTATPE